MSEKLKPCPLCGAPGEINEMDIGVGVTNYVGCSASDDDCGCVITTPFSMKRDAVKAWNQRVPAPQSESVDVEAVKVQLAALIRWAEHANVGGNAIDLSEAKACLAALSQQEQPTEEQGCGTEGCNGDGTRTYNVSGHELTRACPGCLAAATQEQPTEEKGVCQTCNGFGSVTVHEHGPGNVKKCWECNGTGQK